MLNMAGDSMKNAVLYVFNDFIEVMADHFHKVKWQHKLFSKKCRYINYVNVCERDVVDELIYYFLLHGYEVTLCVFERNEKRCRYIRSSNNR